MRCLIITTLSLLFLICSISPAHAEMQMQDIVDQLLKAEKLFYDGYPKESLKILDGLIANPDANKHEVFNVFVANIYVGILQQLRKWTIALLFCIESYYHRNYARYKALYYR